MAVDKVIEAAERAGVILDNLEWVKRRVNGVPGVKYDMGNDGWDSLCLFYDGKVYPTAALVGQIGRTSGRAVGVDMTDEMLVVANENGPKVAGALGYDVVEFRQGFLEDIPVDSKLVDLITSNCVINLSPDKPRVFDEMWRVLDDHGRIVISDIVSEVPVPPHLKVNPRLWDECLVGALTQEEFLARLEQAGFYGLTVLSRTYWKAVEGYAFYSMTVSGRKFEKQAGCVFAGHQFPRN